jgi:type IV pilus modification protein PilV
MNNHSVSNMSSFNNRYLIAGFSLIEVLVALFILAAGVLGITGMQAVSLQNSRQSVGRTQASYLSQEILDRVRANKLQLYSAAMNTLPQVINCFSNSCTTTQLMAFDIAEWKCSFSIYQANEICKTVFVDSRSTSVQEPQLFNSDGSIACSLVSGQRQCAVSIKWQETNAVTKSTEEFNFNITLAL